MIVCQCQRVSDRVVGRAIGEGARTLEDLCSRTGAGQGCGGCLESLRDRLETVSPRETIHAPS